MTESETGSNEHDRNGFVGHWDFLTAFCRSRSVHKLREDEGKNLSMFGADTSDKNIDPMQTRVVFLRLRRY